MKASTESMSFLRSSTEARRTVLLIFSFGWREKRKERRSRLRRRRNLTSNDATTKIEASSPSLRRSPLSTKAILSEKRPPANRSRSSQACSPLEDMALTRTDREREARGADRVVLVLSADVVVAGVARAATIEGPRRIEEATGRAAAEDEEAAATRDCWASPRMSQFERKERGARRWGRGREERECKRN